MTCSAFPFETGNGRITKMVKAAKGADGLRHKVTALLFQGSDTFWKKLLRAGYGGQYSGVVWDDSGPRLSWYSALGAMGPGLKSI